MIARTRRHHPAGMSRVELMALICFFTLVVCGLGVAAMVWKRGSDRSATLMHIRNCQTAMRSHQGMTSLTTGDPFTKSDLAAYMSFPMDILTFEGTISFDPGPEKITGMSSDPATNTDHLWLKIAAPDTKGHIGKYGFKGAAETTGW